MVNSKVISKKLLSLTDLFKAQAFYINKAAKVIIICKNKNFVFAIFLIVLLYFERLNNSKKLSIVSLVLSFYRNHFFKKEDY